MKGSPNLAHRGASAQAKSGGGDRGEEVVRRSNQLHRFRFVDRSVVERGGLEHRDHLAGNVGALGGDRLDLRLEYRVGGAVARERGCRNPGERVKTKRAERRLTDNGKSALHATGDAGGIIPR